MERHHIVYRSQGGLDFPLNYIDLTPEQHLGRAGPHMCKKKDLQYKREMQTQLQIILANPYYTLDEIVKILGVQRKQITRAVKVMQQHEQGYSREDIIRRLMGGKSYADSDTWQTGTGSEDDKQREVC
jgi:hypothetical protein